MADSSFLDWPFFESKHRELVENLRCWCKDNISHQEPEDVDAASKALVILLGDAGWLNYSAPDLRSDDTSLDVRSLCLIRESLAYQSGLADFAFAMQGLGSGAITFFGTDKQKQDYLPFVRAGKKIAAFALSESEAGSDVAALSTSARKLDDAYVLNGEKTFISNAGIADFYIVFARTGEAPGAKGLSAFIVDADTPGVFVSESIEVIAPHPLGKLCFDNCRIPRTNLIGKAGEGFKIAMATLDVFRTTVGAAALGFSRRALDEALARTATRQLFGSAMNSLQLTQASLAEMALEVDASALLIYRAAWSKDQGAARITREAAMAKLYATEAAQKVIDKAVQLFGGLGVVKGVPVESLYREIRALRIYEGASEVQLQIIAKQIIAK